MNLRRILVFLFLVTIPITGITEERTKIGVLDLVEDGPASKGYGGGISSMITTALIDKSSFWVMERAAVANLMKLPDYKSEGAVGSVQLKDLGEKLKVDYLITGTVKRAGWQISAEVRLIEQKTGLIVHYASGTVEKPDKARRLAEELATSIIRRITGPLRNKEIRSIAVFPFNVDSSSVYRPARSPGSFELPKEHLRVKKPSAQWVLLYDSFQIDCLVIRLSDMPNAG